MQTQNRYGKELNKRLNDAYRLISEETIRQIANKEAAISNVVNGLNKECFGVWTYEDGFSSRYTLVYVNGDESLQGEAIDLNLEDKDKFDITMAFCNHLIKEYKHLDLFDVFNTYSHKLRSYVEMFGYRTVSDEELGELEGYNFTLLAKAKGIIYVPFINKLKFYRQFFDNNYSQHQSAGENVVYLLLNVDKGYVKIGRSTRITHREKTLQAQEPKIETIAFWKAPKEAEAHLHKTFAAKRLRGEWFELNFSDMNVIKTLMKDYI